MKKKFLALMLGFTMVMSMTACGGSNDDSNGSPASNNADTSAQEPADESADKSSDESVPADENEDAGEIELVYQEANGLQIALPSDFSAADGGVEGMEAFANADKTAIITVTGPSVDETADPDQLTEEVFAAMFEAGGYVNVTVDNVGAVEQPDGATTVTAFGTGSINDESQKENIVMQYYFMADGSGIYVINYMYPLEDSATDEVIADILASVTVE